VLAGRTPFPLAVSLSDALAVAHTERMAGGAGELVEQQWARFMRWGPYVLLGAGTAVAAATTGLLMTAADWWVAGPLVAAALGLQLCWGRYAARRPPGPSRASGLYYAVRWALAFALTWANPVFGFYAFLGYVTADRLLRGRWVKAGLLANAVTMAGSQSGGLPPQGRLGWVLLGAMLCVNLALIGVFAHLGAKEAERNRVQDATIAELERANVRLEQALRENAALHAQLLVQAREAGVADERRRLAAEIHDTLAQGLTGIIAQLQVVTGVADPAQARAHLERATALARHSLGEARRSVHDLAPAALDHDGLPEALKKAVAQWSRDTGVRADFTVTGTAEPLHGEVEATMLRIGQEAMANAARHAAAGRLGVTLSYMDGELALDVRDDGRGFDPLRLPPRSGTSGFGLAGMRGRAERLAGTVSVESEPGHGTAVSARVPLVRHDR
jgi:signal transduction histidine kinase